MQDNEVVKKKISDYTLAYIQVCSAEMAEFKKQIRVKIDLQANKFSEAKGTNIEMRALFEVPETLFSILKTRLTDDEFKWYGSKEGSRWFAKSFPVFRITEKV